MAIHILGITLLWLLFNQIIYSRTGKMKEHTMGNLGIKVCEVVKESINTLITGSTNEIFGSVSSLFGACYRLQRTSPLHEAV
jgi:hypothetical protein